MNWSGISRKSLIVLLIGGLFLTPIVACGSAGESEATSTSDIGSSKRGIQTPAN
jgi:hypothetical protein